MGENRGKYLEPTSIIDSDHPLVKDYAIRVAGETKDLVDLAVKLYLSVRDGIRYDPYSPFLLPEHYRASYVIERGRSFCIPKASLLCALGRVCGIPSRVGFATVRNHLATKQLIEYLGSDLFVYHGFVEFYLEDRWVKCTPAFNRELCEKYGVAPLEFDGLTDSLFHEYNSENKRYMEYVEFLGTFDDIPVSEILIGFKQAYGEEFFRKSKERLAERGKAALLDFDKEDVWKGE
jgi:transglutaminase-like putative cysteine protease